MIGGRVNRPPDIRELNMKKSTIVRRIIITVLLAAVLLSTPLLFLIKTPREKKTLKCSSTIEINDRNLNPKSNSIDFKVDKAGDHTLYFSLIPDGYDEDSIGEVKPSDLGFVTTLTVTDEAGEIVYSSTQGAVFLDAVVFLRPGNYKVNYYYFSDEDEFYDFESTNIVSIKEAQQMAKDINFPSFKENGKTLFNYEFCCLTKEDGYVFPTIMLSWGLVVGLLFGCFLAEFLMFGKDGEKKFDERQILEQGKAFKIGFFVMLITVEALIVLNFSGLATVVDYPVFYQVAIFLGLLSYVIYCIWHESYFAVNEKSTRVIILFAIIAIINLVIGIINIIHGQLIVDGRITFRILNLFCAIIFIVIFATMLLKRIANSRKSSDDEEEDDE